MAIAYQMAGLQCVCGDVFTASCDIEPTGCAFAWLLLLLSAVVHTMHYCRGDECESDDDEPNTMYSQMHTCIHAQQLKLIHSRVYDSIP